MGTREFSRVHLPKFAANLGMKMGLRCFLTMMYFSSCVCQEHACDLDNTGHCTQAASVGIHNLLEQRDDPLVERDDSGTSFVRKKKKKTKSGNQQHGVLTAEESDSQTVVQKAMEEYTDGEGEDKARVAKEDERKEGNEDSEQVEQQGKQEDTAESDNLAADED